MMQLCVFATARGNEIVTQAKTSCNSNLKLRAHLRRDLLKTNPCACECNYWKIQFSLKLNEDHDFAGTFSENYLQPHTSNAKMTSFIHNLSFVEYKIQIYGE